MTGIDDYAASFSEEPGFLDFAAFGPTGTAVAGELASLTHVLEHARPGAAGALFEQRPRVLRAVSALTGFDASQIVFQPNTTQGLMHAVFGLTGGVLISPAEFPSLPFAAERARAALGAVQPVWLRTEHGRVTPGDIREQLTPSVVAVGVSLVDFRTGYLADLEGIRQVIGDRLLIVDAMQGFGVVDAPWEVADVVAAGGQKWVRAGWGTGFLALGERALEHLTPVWSGINGTDVEGTPMDGVPEPSRSAAAFQVSNPDPLAQARLAGALEQLAEVGVAAVNGRIAERVSEIIDLADEFALPVVSPRAEHERAGIVVLEPEPERLTALAASLVNHGVSATVRAGTARLSAHASTDTETLAMLRAALLSWATS
ncbi:aminotransferase class V-fold PLP-dependent enzyme [Homoserinibacter sp. YIM 151385]|uniref:aminotransferase class V-fold PLP-dependent enzyme n=1 Tax=Homoserinibacter sp. YIM 151385 TaxID=2985506 RepID=UPI0022F0738B|nr:aminotransferase class V-fold PLP-dependent enzyme [Homoserinibacter sp. YIM 151385]WBU38067.1 aminotransferase class V-fold PLP-dependent enzyme [Homoserinibacter sp. YIM 151385]